METASSGKLSYVMTVGDDLQVNSYIFDNFKATSTCENHRSSVGVLINTTMIDMVVFEVIKVFESGRKEREHPENLGRTLRRPCRTVQCRVLLFPRDGTLSWTRDGTL